jgi:iron(III) transport system substrate-binding protein
MKMNPKLLQRGAFASLILSGLLLNACATPAATPSASAASGEVVVYTSRAEALFKPVVEAFNKDFPNIKVTVLTGKNGELAAKLLEEAKAPKADVLINSDTMTMVDLAVKGAFEPNESAVVMAVPAEYRGDKGDWVALTLRPRVIMYNTDLVKPEDLPKTMAELADPKWKGQVAGADSTNGAVIANIAAIRKLDGEAKAEAFIKGMIDNGAKFFSSHTDVRKAVGAGEFKLGWVNHYYYHLSKAENAPVGIVYPDQDGAGLVVNSTNAGIVKGAPHAGNAKIFVDWMLSAAGQKVFAEKNYEYPIVKDVPLAAGVPPLTQFKLAPVTLKSMFDDLEPAKALAQKAGLP